jgi:hypothetical protein
MDTRGHISLPSKLDSGKFGAQRAVMRQAAKASTSVSMIMRTNWPRRLSFFNVNFPPQRPLREIQCDERLMKQIAQTLFSGWPFF